MESFRNALDRITQDFVSELFAIVRAAAAEQLAEREQRETRPKPTRIIRSNSSHAADASPVVVRQLEIPVGVPRRRSRVTRSSSSSRKPAAVPQPKVVKFEVVPHPEQKNRRIVLTRLDTP
jgi:hypothetical protein